MAIVGGYWREASTLMIAARTGTLSKSHISKSSQTSGSSNVAVKHLKPYDYKVLMLKRSKRNKFLPENYVFPGGSISNADFDQNWVAMYENYTKMKFSEIVPGFKLRNTVPPVFQNERKGTNFPAEVAFRICVLRECFEECGILLVRNMEGDKDQKRTIMLSSVDLNSADWRKQVHKDAGQFLKLCQEHKLVPDIWCLYEWCNWLTPVMFPVDKPPDRPARFDTVFYVCCLDYQPHTKVDNREAITAQWQSPGELIEQHYKGTITMIGPQLYELSRLCNFTSMAQLYDFARKREIHGIERWMPVLIPCKDALLSVLPGDELYPQNPDFEGRNPLRTLDKTIEDIKATTSKWNRSQRYQESKWAVQSNIEQTCGHVPPIEDIYIVQGQM